ncbi:MAG TPA: ABC transporter permease subunit [Thermoplasmata archaeon]|nr:ABC transporter permease subunit [Thermoplasmata archaeon]
MTDRTRPFAYLVPVIGFVSLFGILPAAVLFADGVGALGGPSSITSVLGNSLNRAALRNSLEQGAASAIGAFVVGYPVGVFLGRHGWRGRSWMEGILLVPFLLPSLVVVLAVQEVFGPGGFLAPHGGALAALGHGLGGILVVNVVFNVPIVALLTAVGVESGSASLEESALTLGASPARVYQEVWGPPSLIGAFAGCVLTFIFSALAFAAPILLCGPRCYTLEARVYSLASILLEPSAASVLALVMVAFLAVPAVVYLAVVFRLRQRSSPGRHRPIDWGNPMSVALAVTTGVVLGGTIFLLGSVVARSLLPMSGGAGWAGAWLALASPRVEATTGISAGGAIVNTLLFATAAALIALLLGVLAGHSTTRQPRSAPGIQFLLFVPLLLSPVVLAFSLAQFWRPVFGGESTVWLLIILSQATLALPFSLQSVQVALTRLPAGPRESARVLGASPFRAYLDADLPAIRGAITAAALFAFALGLGEFTATYFLATPTFTTLPVLLYSLQSLRQVPAASAAAALLLLVSVGLLVGVSAGGRRVEL